MALSLILLFNFVAIINASEQTLPTYDQSSRIRTSTRTIHAQAQKSNADFSNRNLTEIPNLSDFPLRNIKTLNLSHNRITSLSTAHFHRLTNLEELYLNSNFIQFSNLPDKIFKNLANLQILHIHDNHHNNITLQNHYYLDTLLSPLVSLKDLKMDAVVNETFGPNCKKLRNLTSLSLSCHVNQNQMKFISKDIFDHLSTARITHLNLRGCNITHIHRNAFTNLPHIYEIDLSNNQYLPFAMITKAMYGLKTKSIRTLKLNNIGPVSKWLLKHKYLKNFKMLPLTHLFLDDNTMSQITKFIPKSIQYLSLSKCHLRNASSLRNYSEFEILKIFKYLKKSTRRVSLILRDNNLPYIDITLSHITNLSFLDLSDNEIIYIGSNMRRDIDKLANSKEFTINLHGNTIFCVDIIGTFLEWLIVTRASLIPNKNAYKCQAFNGQILPRDSSYEPLATSIGDLYDDESVETMNKGSIADLNFIIQQVEECENLLNYNENKLQNFRRRVSLQNIITAHNIKVLENTLPVLYRPIILFASLELALCNELIIVSALSEFEFNVLVSMIILGIVVWLIIVRKSYLRRAAKLACYYYRFVARIDLRKPARNVNDTLLNRDAFLSFPDNLQDLIQNTVLPELEINQSLRTYIVKRDLRPGQPEVREKANAICCCRKMVAFINNAYIANEENMFELKLALLDSTHIGQVKIIPVLMEPINFEQTDDVMKKILMSLTSVPFCQEFDVMLNEVVERINDRFVPSMPQRTAASYSNGHCTFKCKIKSSKRRRKNSRTVRIS